MPYIKKLVMHGFKSFPRKTELPFTQGINVVLGPNGSGKSNISDALCFVLGRLNIKSMRAAKAKNLIFLGSKAAAPAKEAMVEIVFDNSDKVFAIDKNEISIKRIVRKNGQSIYKINNETKTRQDVLFLLAQAGLDPNGFNIILQGEIQNFVRMHTEERRKVIEEVSGISVYESRKERSLKELDKTEEKLKEVTAILRERTAYLNNLEKERQEALRFKRLEKDVKRFKASIIYHDLSRKKKEREKINLEASKKNKEIERIKKEIAGITASVESYESKINSINSSIQKSTGFEQERLNNEIANLRAELAGIDVKIETSKKKLSELSRQKTEVQQSIRKSELSIKEMQKSSSKKDGSKSEKHIEAKKEELERLEEQRKKFYMMKSELKSVKEMLHDKKSILQSYVTESEFLLKQIDSISKELFDIKTSEEKIKSLKLSLAEKRDAIERLTQEEIKLGKISHANGCEIERQKKLAETVSKMDVCPLCRSKITKEHIDAITKEASEKVDSLGEEIEDSRKKTDEISKKIEMLKKEVEEISSEISKRESDMVKISSIEEKKEHIKALQEKIDKAKKDISVLEKRRKFLDENFDENSNIDQRYNTLKIEIQEASMKIEENIDSEISFRQRELERIKINFKKIVSDEEELEEELKENEKAKEEKESILEKRKEQEEELSRKFQKLISERDMLQKKIREEESVLSAKRNTVHNIEQSINNLKIERARFDAEIENLEIEMLGFQNVEIIKASKDALIQRLNKTQEALSRIGNVNLRSLEVYDSIKKEYDAVSKKAEVITKEKQGILKVIHEIDVKKKRAFLKTLYELNDIFSRNFSQLSTKGQVSLEVENKKDPFEGGVNIVVKTGHGKYFDVTSLSGGEQTIVALSLIFAIQELKPYYFYILDEIDAALDKRNSERLAGLLKKYMQKGQYIVITHNDEIITNATNLYGVSMHDGISKIVSLKI